jgi:DNA-binding MarR family transcriptional regulator
VSSLSLKMLPPKRARSQLMAVKNFIDYFTRGVLCPRVSAMLEARTLQDVKWLTTEELAAWRSIVRMLIWLPWSIEQQLRRDSSLALIEYQVLVVLSDSPNRTARMSLIAADTNASLSHLSHVVKRLEQRGLVYRQPDPTDGRFTNAILTDDGYQTLVDAAPGHVAHVRSVVIDVLTPEQLRRIGSAADRVVARIDKPPIG